MTEAEIKLETAMRAHTTELLKLIAAILALLTGVFVLGATVMYWYLKFTGGLS